MGFPGQKHPTLIAAFLLLGKNVLCVTPHEREGIGKPASGFPDSVSFFFTWLWILITSLWWILAMTPLFAESRESFSQIFTLGDGLGDHQLTWLLISKYFFNSLFIFLFITRIIWESSPNFPDIDFLMTCWFLIQLECHMWLWLIWNKFFEIF